MTTRADRWAQYAAAFATDYSKDPAQAGRLADALLSEDEERFGPYEARAGGMFAGEVHVLGSEHAEDEVRTLRERLDEERAHHAELMLNALPTNCTACHGSGAHPSPFNDAGPCERCGGWTTHKRLVAGETAELRERCEQLTRERDEARAYAVKASDAECAEVQRSCELQEQLAQLRAQLASAVPAVPVSELRELYSAWVNDSEAPGEELCEKLEELLRTYEQRARAASEAGSDV